MPSKKLGSRGFTLIVSLMLLLIMSGVAIGLLMMVNTEGKVGGQDTQNTQAFHAAEGAIEHMTSDLYGLYQTTLSPSAAQIAALSADAPANSPLMLYENYTLTAPTNADGSLATTSGQVASGPYQGLFAQITPVTMHVTATTSIGGLGTIGDEVDMSRQVEVALVPVFQFGMFSESDLSFFAGSDISFAGKTHTNGDLYLDAGNGATTTFEDKVSAWGNVIRTQLANGEPSAVNHLGTVDILTASSGCPGGLPGCRPLAQTEGSVVAGPGSAQNGVWPALSGGTYATWIMDGNFGNPGGTGATLLSLSFINNAIGAALQPQPYEIIRRPPLGEVPTSALGGSRLYNEAEIRVLLSDDPNELPCGDPSGPPPCGGSVDANNIRLANFNDASNGVNYQNGVKTSFVKTAGMPILGAGDSYTTYFATVSTLMPNRNAAGAPAPSMLSDWLYEPLAPPVVTLFDPLAPVLRTGVTGAPAKSVALAIAPPVVNINTCNTATGVCPPYPWFNTPPMPPAGAGFPAANETAWNLIDGYLRVEYRDAGGAYHPVTKEWLQLGFARGTTPPTAPSIPASAGSNPINPNAILILQEPADRNADGNPDSVGVAPKCVKSGGSYTCTVATPPEVPYDLTTVSPWYGNFLAANSSYTMYNWYPINFYDARDGEVRDVPNGNPSSCTPAGVMNAVELDVGNLKNWLNGAIPGSGTLVDPSFQNGYVLYFSDRRGMLKNPNGTPGGVGAANTKTGDSGLEDSVNSSTALGAPDGKLEPVQPTKAQSPEDVNNNGVLDNWGAANLGLGLGYVGLPYNAATSVNSLIRTAAGAPDPYLTAGRIPQCMIAQKNWVSGARHVLRLVDGSLGNVPVRPAAVNGSFGGFTVAAENPVYIFGNYNTNCSAAGNAGCTPGNLNYDLTWNNPPGAEPAHAAAGVIADAVTMLSNYTPAPAPAVGWSDLSSLTSPSNDAGRVGTTTYYRVAVAGGKNMNFLTQALAWKIGDWGTDGGVHNFLRQLESWGGQILNYKGSMVSMYYATYSTGTDKNGGHTVYDPPATRNYTFDPLFTKPQNMPPGTPMFRDIDNLSYRQSFTPHTGAY
jgi:Tfp pilus assembly protein PilX